MSRGVTLLFLGPRHSRWEWGVSPTPRPPLPPGKTPCPLYRRLGGPQSRSGRAENLVHTRIRSRTVQPIVSRFTDWDTRPTSIRNSFIKYVSYKSQVLRNNIAFIAVHPVGCAKQLYNLNVTARHLFFWCSFYPIPSPCLPLRGFTVTLTGPTTFSRNPLDERSARLRDLFTWKHTTLIRDRHPRPRWDSNPQSQQASGSRPTP